MALSHAFQQMKKLGGHGDFLEDDLEWLDQMINDTSEYTSNIKNKEQQTYSNSKFVAKLNKKDIQVAIWKVDVDSKILRGGHSMPNLVKWKEINVEVEREELNKLVSHYEQQKLRLLDLWLQLVVAYF